MHPPKSDDFRNAINEKIKSGEKNHLQYVDIRSGDLHRELGYYPGPNHRMPLCCDVMYSLMIVGDEIIQSPPRGRGANLLIRYKIPHNVTVSNISQTLQTSIKKFEPEQDILKELSQLSNRHPDLVELKKFQQLMDVTPNSAVAEVRRITEKICRRIYENREVPTQTYSFNELCGQLKYDNLLDEKILSYVNTIRIMGNTAIHNPTISFKEKDAIIAGSLLCEVLNFIFDNNLI